MINPTGNKLEKLLFGIFDKSIKNADRYNHNKSLWLIITDEMKWVVEYTDSQTLWYNYQFFKNEMELVGLDCVENKDLIQKWFETRFLNTYVVKSNEHLSFDNFWEVEDTIQNGVKNTNTAFSGDKFAVEEAIQNGVKNTQSTSALQDYTVEDTIQNGVKHTMWSNDYDDVEDTIQNGVKYTSSGSGKPYWEVEDTIQNGVKETIESYVEGVGTVKEVIEDGVKEIKTPGEDGDLVGILDFMLNNNTNSIPNLIDDVIENGVKETKGTLRRTLLGVDDIVKNGVKETKGLGPSEVTEKEINSTIQNGVKVTKGKIQHMVFVKAVIQNGVMHTQKIDWNRDIGMIGDVIQSGVKETKPIDDWVNSENIINKTIQNGVKETNPHVLLCDDEIVKEVIEDGVKEIHGVGENHRVLRRVKNIIKNGVKEIHDDCSNNIARVEGIIKIGEKLD